MTPKSQKDSRADLATALSVHVDRERLREYVYFAESLSEIERNRIDLHLSICDQCRAEHEAESQRFVEFFESTDQQADRELFQRAFESAETEYLAEVAASQGGPACLQPEVGEVASVSADEGMITCPPFDAAEEHQSPPPAAPPEPTDSTAQRARFGASWQELLAIHSGGGKILHRLEEQMFAKFALGWVFDHVLRQGEDEILFVESGSTLKSALTAVDSFWARSTPLGRRVFVETNNSKIADWMPGSEDALLVRAIFGGYLDAYFGGFFPLSERQINNAIRDCNDDDTHATHAAWWEMLERAWHYQRLFMTASHFNFLAGPFVGSKQNALLKNAYYSSGRRIAILLDGSKLVPNGLLVRRWMNERCVQVFDDGHDIAVRRFLKQVFGLKPGDNLPAELPGIPDDLPKAFMDVWNAKTAAADRNPRCALKLPAAFVNGFRPGNAVRIEPFESWEDCVKCKLGKWNGEVCVYISEPDEPEKREGFAQLLHDMIAEANGCFRDNATRVQIEEPIQHDVVVNLRNESQPFVLPAGNEGVPVRLWECHYTLVDRGCDTEKTARTAERPTEGVAV